MKRNSISAVHGSFRAVYNRLVRHIPILRKRVRNKKYEKKIIHPAIVIAGFPRSANTYLTLVMKTRLDAIGAKVNIISHDHTVDIIKYSKENRIPCIVPVRNPHEAILSTYIYHNEARSIAYLMKWYADFYRYVEQHFDHFVVVRYEDAIDNTNDVVRNISKRIGIQMPAVDIEDEKKHAFELMNHHSHEIKRTTSDHIRQVAHPVEERIELKELYATRVKEELEKNDAIARLYKRICSRSRIAAGESSLDLAG